MGHTFGPGEVGRLQLSEPPKSSCCSSCTGCGRPTVDASDLTRLPALSTPSDQPDALEPALLAGSVKLDATVARDCFGDGVPGTAGDVWPEESESFRLDSSQPQSAKAGACGVMHLIGAGLQGSV